MPQNSPLTRSPGSPLLSAVIAGVSVFLLPGGPVGVLFCLYPGIAWRSWKLVGVGLMLGLAADLGIIFVLSCFDYDGLNTRAWYCEELWHYLNPHLSPAHPSVSSKSNEVLFKVNFVARFSALFAVWYWLWPVNKSVGRFALTMLSALTLSTGAAQLLWSSTLYLGLGSRRYAGPGSDVDAAGFALIMLAVMAILAGTVGSTIAYLNGRAADAKSK